MADDVQSGGANGITVTHAHTAARSLYHAGKRLVNERNDNDTERSWTLVGALRVDCVGGQMPLIRIEPR